ncbi:MAG: Ribonuclease E [uncultured Sphingosinicella sp.]|uniref:Ribonuclease E n=1 Tax=uncultured Sphingosinicella sp. TaxID=478748 RepID=A0A6J4UJX1_9SPHN|nr:ribonuclease [uncultured Sphingosinicella sp.]CAA9549476.1 MAG: Ribonuclease E [uncultured Sphingosinicella sp.]
MAEWLYEEGIGENRAALVEDGTILEAAVELPGQLRVRSVHSGRLSSILIPGRRGVVTLASGEEIFVEPLPPALTQGARVRVEITREALSELARSKAAKGRISDEEERPGPSLLERLQASGETLAATRPAERDRLEEAGWSELLEEAASGRIDFPGGSLQMSLTPAMTLFDVDGALPPPALAVAGAEAAGRAIRRLGIGGSIGIDLPTLASKADRQAAAAALDAVLPQPFERTAVNGFGFLQLVRRRERASVPELVQFDPAGAAARALLRRAERSSGSGPRIVAAPPVVIARIEARPEWLAMLERRIGAPVRLRGEPGLAISSGHVHADFP